MARHQPRCGLLETADGRGPVGGAGSRLPDEFLVEVVDVDETPHEVYYRLRHLADMDPAVEPTLDNTRSWLPPPLNEVEAAPGEAADEGASD